ncbi:MAG: ParB/RepB/Spo0J family partition protein [Oscillospiraceae bacterium]|nr:ParB/RepB/Spo0J family partition protein [Oscillospiraceae bacterium]MDD4414780.1 ParB/RepB/Spo0J family partition protein [Oscillospiraceae bacterium]
MAVIKGGLGKGLGALLTENFIEDEAKPVTLRISEIEPNRSQPRKQFDEDSLSELSDSIAQHGILQPLLVRPLTDGSYQLVAGERRWRAARMAGLTEVPVVIREITDRQAAELALIENLQREDLNPMEEAQGYKTLMDNHGLTQEETAKAVNKSRPAVANALRLLNLPDSVADLVLEGKLSAGHARAILSFATKQEQEEAAQTVIKGGLSVREIENMVKKSNAVIKDKNKAPKSARDSFYDEVELALTEHLGRRVRVTQSQKGGVLQIEFYSQDDLRMLANGFSSEN